MLAYNKRIKERKVEGVALSLLFLFLIKIIDNLIVTGRTLLIQQQREVLASVSVAISQILFFLVTSKVIFSDNIMTMIVVSLAAGIGTYLAMKWNRFSSKERMFISSVLSDDKEAMIELSEYLKENRIKNLITDSYTKDWGKTLAITVYADTAYKQNLFEVFIKQSKRKYLVISN